MTPRRTVSPSNSISRLLCAALLLPLLTASIAPAQPASTPLRDQAFALERAGRTADAESLWQQLASQDASNPEPFAHLGLLEARQQHLPQAIANYQRAFALNPQFPGLALNLGLAQFKSGNYSAAIAQFKPLLAATPPASPDSLRLNELLGMAHFGLRQYSQAQPYLFQAAQSDSANLALLLALANSCLLSANYQCVLSTYHRIVLINPDSAEAHMLMGEALDAMKDAHGAIAQFRAAIAANPHWPNAHFSLGYLLWTQTQYEQATQEFSAELETTPNHLQATLYLADSLLALGNPSSAEPLLRRALTQDPNNPIAHRDLGILLADRSPTDDALAELTLATRLDPADVSAHLHLARLYRSFHRTADAKQEFDLAGKLNKAEFQSVVHLMSDPTPAPAIPPAP